MTTVNLKPDISGLFVNKTAEPLPIGTYFVGYNRALGSHVRHLFVKTPIACFAVTNPSIYFLHPCDVSVIYEVPELEINFPATRY